MSIRSEMMATTYRGDLSYQLQDILRRNGMRAQVALNNDQFILLVQGHDSPLLEYPITEKQFHALTDSGTNYANKKAYNTFNNIVSKDFDVPSSFVAARNVNGHVAMGLHGYREQYPGRSSLYPPRAVPPGFLGLRPPMQDGFHLRRVGDTVMVPEHTDGRIRPGELKSGAYGYYYKGQPQAVTVQQDPLKDLHQIFVQERSSPRPTEPAKSYKELITSPVYFSNEKWQEILSSHGIVIDEAQKSMTVLSKGTKQDFVYTLNDEDLKKLTDNSLKSTPMDERLNIINKFISQDFNEKVTMDMLNSKEVISITPKPENVTIQAEQSPTLQINENQLQHEIVAEPRYAPTINPESGYVNGQDLQALNEEKGWYREGKHGREVIVGDIWVEKVEAQTEEKSSKAEIQHSEPSEKQATEKPKEKEGEVTYKMSAVINGNVISYDISKRQYDKFMAVDDYQRQRMMSKIFSEVDMKTRPEMREKFHLGAFLTAGLTALSDLTFLGADVAHNISHIKDPHPRPEIYAEIHGPAHILYKPGTDRPEDIARRAFDAGIIAAQTNNDMNRGR